MVQNGRLLYVNAITCLNSPKDNSRMVTSSAYILFRMNTTPLTSDEEGRSPSRQDANKFHWEFPDWSDKDEQRSSDLSVEFGGKYSDWSDEDEGQQRTQSGILKATQYRDTNGNKPKKCVSFDWSLTTIHYIPRNRDKKKSQKGFIHSYKLFYVTLLILGDADGIVTVGVEEKKPRYDEKPTGVKCLENQRRGSPGRGRGRGYRKSQKSENPNQSRELGSVQRIGVSPENRGRGRGRGRIRSL